MAYNTTSREQIKERKNKNKERTEQKINIDKEETKQINKARTQENATAREQIKERKNINKERTEQKKNKQRRNLIMYLAWFAYLFVHRCPCQKPNKILLLLL